MKIKELEKTLSVSRSNIRFYEKEGLLSPERSENNYRDYTDEDITELKKILSLRKLGFTVEEISMLQKKEITLPETAENNIKRLEEEIEALKYALKLTKELSKEPLEYDEIEAEKLWNTISSAEKSGAVFVDICKDFLNFEFVILDHNPFFLNFKSIRKSRGTIYALLIFLIFLTIRGLVKKFVWNGSFFEGFFYPLLTFGVASIILLPLWLLRKNSPRAADIYMMFLFILCLAFLAFIVLLIVFLLIWSCFN